MSESISGRRAFLRHSALVAGAVAAPMGVFGAAPLPPNRRQEWQAFKTGAHYGALVDAIGTMKANTNADDPASWAYWVNIHLARCTHGVPYFLGWHRGYLYHFEKRLRQVSGDSALALPYWDYYANANLPAEFTDPSPGNPLYVEDRANTNVRPALSLSPFSGSLTNFQTGASQAFEPAVEQAPHNNFHNLIGGIMSDMQAPVDPIFWLHHCNIDRLWVAWYAAGASRRMPLRLNAYWSGDFTYASTLTMPRVQTYDTANLAYYYQDQGMPTSLPAPEAGEGAMSLLASGTAKGPMPPAVGTFRLSNPRATSASTFASAGALDVALGERSLSVQLPSSSDHSQAIARIARGEAAPIRGSALKYRSVHLVLDDIAVTTAGGHGGYFYNVYLNVAATRSSKSASRSSLIGTLGPFQVRAAAHQRRGPAKLRYIVTPLLADIALVDIGMATVSFVRVNGERSPGGSAIEVGEVRIELSADGEQS